MNNQLVEIEARYLKRGDLVLDTRRRELCLSEIVAVTRGREIRVSYEDFEDDFFEAGEKVYIQNDLDTIF